MKFTLCILLVLFTTSAFADANARLQQKASDFFKNPNSKRNLIKLLSTHPFDIEEDEEAVTYPSFELDGEFGILMTTGNTNSRMLKLAFDSDHEFESWSNQYFMQVLRQQTEVDGVKNIDNNRVQVSSQFDYKLLNPKYRLFAYAEYDDNQFLELRHQISGVVGWSHVAWKHDHTEFRYSLGPGWAHSEQEDTGLEINEFIVKATANYAYRFKNDARFRQTITAEIGEMNNKARSLTSISAKIYEQLAMKFSFEMSLDENVSQNIDNFTTQTSVSMVYQFF
jgi:putative salt-induced outer membrane protein YdiY